MGVSDRLRERHLYQELHWGLWSRLTELHLVYQIGRGNIIEEYQINGEKVIEEHQIGGGNIIRE